MKCIDCKWFAGTHNDTYGVCKRYPHIENKSQQDWCGEFASKAIVITPVQEEQVEYDINTDEVKPKRGRKPKQ
jgi:hypothetical protein